MKRSEKQRKKGKIFPFEFTEFQRITRRDKKAFLSAKKSSRKGKTRDLIKKIRDTKGTFHAKMGSMKNRNCMYLTVAEDI